MDFSHKRMYICLVALTFNRTHMQDLKDVTNNVHYENYRCLKLAGVVNSPDPKSFQAPSRYDSEEQKKTACTAETNSAKLIFEPY